MYRAVSSLIAIAIVASLASLLGVAAYTFLHSSYQIHLQLYRGLPAMVRCWNLTNLWICSVRVFDNVYGNISIVTSDAVVACGSRYLEGGEPSICITNTSSKPLVALIDVGGSIYSYTIDVGEVW